MKTLRFAVIPLAVVAASLSAQVASAQQLTGAEIRALVEGKTYRFEVPERGFFGTVTVASDGTHRMTSNIPGSETDTGRWRISGDQVCSIWTRIRNGAESCQTFTRESDRTFVTSTGTRLIFD